MTCSFTHAISEAQTCTRKNWSPLLWTWQTRGRLSLSRCSYRYIPILVVWPPTAGSGPSSLQRRRPDRATPQILITVAMAYIRRANRTSKGGHCRSQQLCIQPPRYRLPYSDIQSRAVASCEHRLNAERGVTGVFIRIPKTHHSYSVVFRLTCRVYSQSTTRVAQTSEIVFLEAAQRWTFFFESDCRYHQMAILAGTFLSCLNSTASVIMWWIDSSIFSTATFCVDHADGICNCIF